MRCQVANLVRGECNPAVAAAIMADLVRAVMDSTAELVGDGKGGGGAQKQEGGEGASKDGSSSLSLLTSSLPHVGLSRHMKIY